MLQLRSPAGQIKTTSFAHTAETSSKTPLVINSTLLIPIGDADANKVNSFVYEAEISDVAKAAGAIKVADAVYWDATNKCITTTSTDNTLCGHALEASASADTTTGLIAFNAFAAS